MEQLEYGVKHNDNRGKYIVQFLLIILTEIIVLILTKNQTDLLNDEFNQNHSTLEFAHVLFRHGHRTPIRMLGYPNDPYVNYTYEPNGDEGMTYEGERLMYKLGQFLRKYYSNFLGDYFRGIVYGESSPSARCRKSLLIVLASLFPPPKEQQLEKNLKWQPIEYYYSPTETNKIFITQYNCPRFMKLIEIENTIIMKEELGEDIQEIINYCTRHSGMNITRLSDFYFLYDHLLIQQELGLTLPKWTEKVFPDPLAEYSLRMFRMPSRTDDLKTLSGGFILEDMISTTLSKLEGTPKLQQRKLNLYSGHDFTMMSLLGTLGFEIKERTPYGSFIAMEIHKIGQANAVKILYHDYKTKLPRVLKLEGCEELCSLDKFLQLYGKFRANRDMCYQ